MSGDYDFVIGMAKDEPLSRFLRRHSAAAGSSRPTGAATLCGVAVETDDATGLARRASRRCASAALLEQARAGFLGRQLAFDFAGSPRAYKRARSTSTDPLRRLRRRKEPWPDIPNSRTSCTARAGRTRSRSKLFSKLAREITVAAKLGTARPGDEPAPARRDA